LTRIETGQALDDARSAGVPIADEPPQAWGLGIHDLLGIGVARALKGQMARCLGLTPTIAAPLSVR
jgi:hypothetical protein